MNYNKVSVTKETVEHEVPAKVISGDVKVKNKGAGKRIAEELVNDNVSNVRSYIFEDVIIPGLKRGIYDAVVGAVGMMLGVEGRRVSSSSGSKVPYNVFWDNKTRTTAQPQTVGRRTSFEVKDIFFESRAEAEEVLSGLDEVLDKYDGVVSVADYYGLSGVTSSPIDFKWGWNDLTNALVTNTRDGFLIKLPRVIAIN